MQNLNICEIEYNYIVQNGNGQVGKNYGNMMFKKKMKK